jgi:hypothetical protein
MGDTYTWRKARHILLVREGDRKGSVDKKVSVRESQGAWRQEGLIGDKTPVVK